MANEWYPGKKPTREEELLAEITRLRRQVDELEKAASRQNWIDNPDTMGGAFTRYEIERARDDKW